MSVTELETHDDARLVPTITRNDTDDPVIIIQPSDPETHSTSDISSEMLMLPIPTHLTNQSSFALSELIDETDLVPSELADADISFASDKSYVETPSAQAAQKLKKYWDQKLGVGKEVRSPYVITAFVNLYGKQMFRVSGRELSAPLAASSADIDEHASSSVASPSEPSTSPRAKRRSRISAHNIPAISIFNKNGSSSKVHTTQPSAPRKLRKTRSIPDMSANDAPTTQGPPALGRLHSRSVTAADVSPFSTVVRNSNTIDLFGQLMEWHPLPSTSGSVSSNSLTSDESAYESHDEFKSPIINALPFGQGVSYDSPARKTSFSDLLPPPIPRHLREV
ncbi:hypothetical protein H0H92_009646 [Tricholoma furcatifolium]|nr:hypothetical protein H0H92_009646 [Tricholoma furcatifolium]